ncbi:FG-GAP and VCBS repeat-containing protein [Phytomonospora endophytica]|uniref:FG-GAP repeat protein n=1 Tax=Phytomonospora endophytica TaxID=714109 RepID=A0A841G3A8_9ACTN|nr:FG-GAP and VCBS repeat-containing protein [Phytomonospora endophytica]MBB6038600.1 hypothetical protein [Phytomonospora endophytica]GIG69257.1 hypothetical protein Pen01_55520 [Phytomonospora endophytica]
MTSPRGGRILLATALSACAVAPALALTGAPAFAAGCVGGVDNDFDGDGKRDLAIADTFNYDDSGQVVIRYSATPWNWNGITQNTDGVPGGSEPDDLFGTDMASADFNGDGCSDLVVSAPGEDLGGKVDAGQIWIIPGAPGGLNLAATKAYSQDSPGLPGGVESSDYFGYSVEAGNRADGSPYLLVGSPGEEFKSSWGEGTVYYQRSGKWTTFNQDSPGVAGSAEGSDRFGEYVAATDDHIIVGAPTEKIGKDADAGSISIFAHATGSGLPKPIAGLDQDSTKLAGSAESGDQFGAALSAIPYLPDGAAVPGTLVAVGVPGEDLGSASQAGMAHTLYISPEGKVSQLAHYNQDLSGVTGSAEKNDWFGTEVRLAKAAPGQPYATPDTAMLALTVWGEDNPDGSFGAIQAFVIGQTAGTGDRWIVGGAYGLPDRAFISRPPCVGVSDDHLYAGYSSGPILYGIPWGNVRDGGTGEVTNTMPGWGGDSYGCSSFL